jgi:hypothetical protein
MDDFGAVDGSVREVGAWRGPAERPWLRRIAHGAGFNDHWDHSQLPREPDAAVGPTPDVRAGRRQSAERLSADSLRMWWLPGSHDP